jgi:hypothetical protein
VDTAKSKVTIYIRPELHKQLKLRAVQEDMKMSELAEIMLERYLLRLSEESPTVCPNCKTEILSGTNRESVSSKLPVGSA